MPELSGKRRAIVDAFANLTADITPGPHAADPQRLRSALASALRAQLNAKPARAVIVPPPPRMPHAGLESARADLLRDLDELAGEGDYPKEALAVVRRDERDTLLLGQPIDGLSRLAPAERLGPFATHGGSDVWFDVFLTASRIEVRETGASAPLLVFTKAQPPVLGRTSTSIAIEEGTIWIRGDQIGGLPANAFAGVKVTGGALKINQRATVSGGVAQIATPYKAVLEVKLAEDAVTPAEGACDSSDAKVALPASLTFTLTPGSAAATGDPGKAAVWGQKFDFGPCTGAWTFVEPLWLVALSYDVSPTEFDADPIADDLAHFEGKSDVSAAGLGLPVVVAANPAILGEAAQSASWLLQLKQLLARWYDPDPRLHELSLAWLDISAFGALIVAEGVAPLSPPVSHVYDLWTIAGSDKRLPWRQSYADPFTFFYRCHVVDGEDLLVRGQARVDLDRPVTTDGAPIPTPTTQSALLLHKFGGAITASLAAAIAEDAALHQFALRNALVWTSEPSFIFVRGALALPAQIDSGNTQLLFGVYAWAPTLPDPYVVNAIIHRPLERAGEPQAMLTARIIWSAPDRVAVTFEGRVGSNLALGGRSASAGDPRPARKSDGDPDVGLTQVEQDRMTFDDKTAQIWREAQGLEVQTRGRRFEIAQQENKRSIGMIDGYLNEMIGPAPNLLLLDVSTNQDLLGVGVGARFVQDAAGAALPGAASDNLPVADLAVYSPVAGMRVLALPQVQWEPVRTLDADQDIMTMGWFPTPLASANDGGSTQIGARYQKLMPIIPDDALRGTADAYQDGTPVGIRTTFPFGLIAAALVQPNGTPQRKADLYELTRPKFPDVQSTGGIQVTARAEGGRPDDGGISPMFQGRMRQLLNGVDLASGAPLGLSVLGETLQPAGSVETIFNNDMSANPRVPVTRIDISGYGGSNYSDWNNPFAAFAEAAKVQFRFMIGRTALEVIKVNSVLHPWGVRVTRSVTIERRPGGGVIRRDSGWQAFTPGLFDYRYISGGSIVVAPYQFDAGVFRGLFNVRTIRPAPGSVFSSGAATLVPYYFDADVALEGVPGRTASVGILGYLQTTPNGVPADASAIQALIQMQGPIGGPIETWMDFGGSGLPFRAQRVEVGLAMSGGTPVFVATVRGAPKLPTTGAWSVAMRPVASIPPNGGEAVPVAENRGVPVIRRYPVQYPTNDAVFSEPPLAGAPGDYRFADAADLLTPATPANDYALVQSAPTHAFLFPRPFVPSGGAARIESGYKPALADVFARSTSKGAFPPSGNTIELAAGAMHFNVGSSGKLALSSPVSISGYPTPLRLGGTTGHGSSLFYDTATLTLDLEEDRWDAEFTGLRVWSDISGLERITGSELRVVGSTDQRSQIAEIKTLILQEIEDILQYIPIFGQRGVQGPIDLAATNAKHELKIEVSLKVNVPPPTVIATFPAGSGVVLTLTVKQSTGIDLATGGPKASATFGADLEGKVPLLSVGVATVFLIITGSVAFSLTSVSGSVTAEKLELLAFVGVGVEGKIGPFKAYAFLGIGFNLVYDAIANQTKYGGLVALEAGVDLVVVKVKIRAELKGLVYKDAGATKCDYSGSVKIQVDIFLIFSISATYLVTETATI